MTIALLGRRASSWLQSIARLCRSDCVLLDLESALHGGGSTLDGAQVHWDGFALHTAQAVLVERAAFAWPQPGSGEHGLSPQAEREARALLLSALWTTAESVPVLEHPRHASKCIAPALALELCARAGIAVQPWTLRSRRPADGDRLWLDPGGRELRYEPRDPGPGEPAFAPEPFEGPLWTVLAVDGAALGARRYESASAWRSGLHEGLVPAPEVPAAAARAALRAREALALSWIEVVLRADDLEPALVYLSPDADLGRWDEDLSGAVSRAVAVLLESKIGIPR